MRKQEWQTLVAECRASSMTAKAWCEAKSIDYRLYLKWVSKLNREEQPDTQQWADVTMKKEILTSDEIKLNCGKWTICVGTAFSPALLAEVLRVVDTIC